VKLTTALLCDYASVRESLLHILGGGVTRVKSAALPGRAGIMLAIMVSPNDWDDLIADHNLAIQITEAGQQEQVGYAAAVFSAPTAREEAGPLPSLPIVLSLADFGLPRFGLYSVDITLDGEAAATLQFSLEESPAPAVTSQPEDDTASADQVP
jgi:hypothetical protein